MTSIKKIYVAPVGGASNAAYGKRCERKTGRRGIHQTGGTVRYSKGSRGPVDVYVYAPNNGPIYASQVKASRAESKGLPRVGIAAKKELIEYCKEYAIIRKREVTPMIALHKGKISEYWLFSTVYPYALTQQIWT